MNRASERVQADASQGFIRAGDPMSGAAQAYFSRESRWHDALAKLRAVALEFPLQEELKWGCPCYTLDGSNVVLLHVFKQYCAMLFFKGALLKDKHRVLVQQTKNVQAARQIRFTDASEVDALKPVLRECIREAIAVEKAGLAVPKKRTDEYEMPPEFQARLDGRPALKKAFLALTPGRQRAYLLHFASAKLSKTREARVRKCEGRIMEGKGLDDPP